MLMSYIILAIGGALGAILRYLVSIYFSKLFGNYFPIGTLIVNIIGSFILGFFMGLKITTYIFKKNFYCNRIFWKFYYNVFS